MRHLHTFWIPYEKGFKAPELNGICVWLQRLKSATADDPNLTTSLFGCCNGTFSPPAWVDLWAKSRTEARELLEQKISETDVLFINGTYDWLSLIAESRSLLRKKPHIVAVVHNDNAFEYYKPLAYFEPIVDHFIAVSNECRNGVLDHMPHRSGDISVLPCFVPTPKETHHLVSRESSQIRLVYVGRISTHQKRVLDLIKLLMELRSLSVNFSLTIAGEGEQLETLKTAVNELSFTKEVRILGRIPHDSVGQLMREHDVFVQVSEFEGTSTSLLEAMANGIVPVVTRASSGIVGVVTPGVDGEIVDIGDMAALANTISMLAVDRERLEKLSARASSRAVSFGWQAYRTDYIRVLEDVRKKAIRRRWPWRLEPIPSRVAWARCWDQNKIAESGRLDYFPLPLRWKKYIRGLLK